MNKKIYTIYLFVLFLIFKCPLVGFSQIEGYVFRDVNNDGIWQLTNPTEPGEFGVNINIYNASNILLGSTVTNASGYYNFSVMQAPAGTAIRVEFLLTTDNFPSRRINADKSNVQFIVAGPFAVDINFAIASKKLLSSNNNPFVATTGYVNGDANGSSATNNAGDYNNLYVFPYDLSTDGGSARRALNKHLGAVFGMAWQKESRTLFMAAYLKRHCSFGPNGIGAIYQSQISTTGVPSTPTLLVDVSSIGIDVGTDPRKFLLPSDATQPNTDEGVFGMVGKTGIGGIELSNDGRELYLINMYEKKLHRINIGNPIKGVITAADVTGNWTLPDPSIPGTEWLPMALELKNNKFYIGGITSKQTTIAHNIADTANLRGFVYEFDPATNVFTEVLQFPLTHRRGFVNSDYRYEFRNNYWCAWQNNGDISLGGPLRTGLIGSTTTSNATGIYYPQPMFSAIKFDIDGSMIIGIRDRFGDQGGYANFFETGNVPGETYRTLATGEVLRAGKNGSTWVFENAGSVTSNGVTTTTPGVTDNNFPLTGSFTGMTGTPYGGSYGPGNKYYYYNFNFSLTGVPPPFNSGVTLRNHYLKSNGGLAFLPGYNEVVTTAIDPTSAAFTNGILKNVNLGTQAGNMSARMNLTTSVSGDPALMGKAAALGDLEVLLDAHEMEIGNRVWEDNNLNGLQDADEPGMPGVIISLRSSGTDNIYNTADDQVWNTTTDANGNYYFDHTNVNDLRRPSTWLGVSPTNSGVLPGFEYRVELFYVQPALTNYVLTVTNAPNDAINSEGNNNGMYVYQVINPGGSTAAGSSFENNYNIDFGFFNIVILPQNKLELSATASDNQEANINWKTTDEVDVNVYEVERSTDGNFFFSVGNVISKGTGSFSYSFTDDLSSINNKIVYYRLKINNKNGKYLYSYIVRIDLYNRVKIAVMPNPFSTYLSIQFNTAKKDIASIKIVTLSGQKIFSKKLTAEKGTSTFILNEFAALPKGIYLIEIITSIGSLKQKLLKQ